MLVVGVDEAGYGPLLGPLVVAGAAFRVAGGDGTGRTGGVGGALEGLVGRPGAGVPGGLVVGDSKRLHDRQRGLGSLERTLLAFAAAAGARAADLASLDSWLLAVGVDPAGRTAHRWYSGDLVPFPRAGDPSVAEAAGATLAEALRERDAAFLGLAADVVPEGRLNGLLRGSGNKGDTLFDLSAGVLERLLAHRLPGEAALAVLDRQGGRARYQPQLTRRWPDRFAWTLEEGPRCSRYRLDLGGETELRFLVEGDAAEPQVGLASMLAKYLRELHMELWNGWFGVLCPEVRPTAGYTEDGRRWMAETREARERAGIADEDLVRIR